MNNTITMNTTGNTTVVVYVGYNSTLPAGHSLGAHVTLSSGAGHYLRGQLADEAEAEGFDLVIVERPDYMRMAAAKVAADISDLLMEARQERAEDEEDDEDDLRAMFRQRYGRDYDDGDEDAALVDLVYA